MGNLAVNLHGTISASPVLPVGISLSPPNGVPIQHTMQRVDALDLGLEGVLMLLDLLDRVLAGEEVRAW